MHTYTHKQLTMQCAFKSVITQFIFGRDDTEHNKDDDR